MLFNNSINLLIVITNYILKIYVLTMTHFLFLNMKCLIYIIDHAVLHIFFFISCKCLNILYYNYKTHL